MDNKNSKYINIALAVGGFIAVVWFLFAQGSETERSIVLPVIMGVVILIIFIASSFGGSIAKRLKKLTSLSEDRKLLTEKEVDDIVYRIVKGTSEKRYQDGLFRNVKKIENRKTKEVDGNEIYAVRVRLSGSISFGGKEIDGLWVVLNATYPKLMPSILPEQDEEKLEDEMDFKSKNYRNPTVTEEVTENESLGFRSRRTTTAPNKEEGKEKEEAVM